MNARLIEAPDRSVLKSGRDFDRRGITGWLIDLGWISVQRIFEVCMNKKKKRVKLVTKGWYGKGSRGKGRGEERKKR